MAIAGQYSVETDSPSIPATMQAAVYRGINDVRLESVPVPKIGPNEMLVRVHSCGVCGTDLKKISTGSHSAPRIFGHETSGVVAAVGSNVNISITAGTAIAFNSIGTLSLQTGLGFGASFTASGGAISFANTANTVDTAGGSIAFPTVASLPAFFRLAVILPCA